MEKQKRENRTIINIGTSLMVVILIGLSFAVIAALAVSSSHNNYNLSKKLADHNTEYYVASNEAYEIIAASSWADQDFTVEVNSNQILKVEVKNGEISTWEIENTGSWEADSTQPVITLE
ncbi:MAG: hypothetical protein K6D38_00915 [Pseudobutyrivibrio sp.]|nr:hypothetical protein [Pseudobutyrivibrio sp.]